MGAVFKAGKIVAVIFGQQLLNFVLQEVVQLRCAYIFVAGNAGLYPFDDLQRGFYANIRVRMKK
jgi:hypothetical protein